MLEYIIVQEASEKWGVSTRRIQILCSTGRIPGAIKRAGSWFIPANAEKPKDERVKTENKMTKNEGC